MANNLISTAEVFGWCGGEHTSRTVWIATSRSFVESQKQRWANIDVSTNVVRWRNSNTRVYHTKV